MTIPEFFYQTSLSAEGLAEQQHPLLAQFVHWQVQLWQRALLWQQGLHQVWTALTCQLIIKQSRWRNKTYKEVTGSGGKKSRPSDSPDSKERLKL